MKSNRIARITYDLILVILLLLPLISWCFSLWTSGSGVLFIQDEAYDFGNYVMSYYGCGFTSVFYGLTSIADIFGLELLNIIPYLSYLVCTVFMWVAVQVLLFLPRLCIKFMRRIDT